MTEKLEQSWKCLENKGISVIRTKYMICNFGNFDSNNYTTILLKDNLFQI